MGEGVECGTGYEVSPLRVNLEAIVEQPQLHLESDTDHGLHFSHPASILLHRDQVSSSQILYFSLLQVHSFVVCM